MAPIGSTISIRLIGFLLAAVVLFNLVMGLAIFAPLGRSQGEVDRLPLPRQMAAIVDLLDAADPAARPDILSALNSSTLAVDLVDSLPSTGDGANVESGESASAPLLTRFLDMYDKAFSTRDLHVDLQRGGLLDRVSGGGEEWSAVRIFVKLSDGKWVLIQPIRGALLSGVLWRGLLIVAITGLVVIALLVIAVRQTARPIEQLASGARMFADRLDAHDLEVKGSKELRDLAAAFNDMKTRIRSLVQERTRLVAAIAHDLRTYLTRLRMRVEFISDPKQRERAEADIEEMSALIGDTLLFAKSVEQSGAAPTAIDIAAEIRSFVSVRQEMGDEVTVGAMPSGTTMALVEPVALRRILSNLTDNAVRYARAASVSVSVTVDSVTLSVEDNGPGIPPSEIDRIVAPFERLDSSRGRDSGGAGLGLAIVKALTELNDGVFSLSNRHAGGVLAEVTFRRSRKVAANAL